MANRRNNVWELAITDPWQICASKEIEGLFWKKGKAVKEMRRIVKQYKQKIVSHHQEHEGKSVFALQNGDLWILEKVEVN